MELIGIEDIDIEVSFKEIKNVHLSVHPPLGKVTVSAPQHINLDKFRVYAATKLPWIRKEQKKITGQEREPLKEYITREVIFSSASAICSMLYRLSKTMSGSSIRKLNC